MENQKIENALNLALEATVKEREESLDLAVGYNIEEKSWDLIIKYSKNIDDLLMKYQGVQLLNQYAILTVPETDIEVIAKNPRIEYVEKPKSLYYERVNAMRSSCIPPLQGGENQLLGKGVLIAILDSGIDYRNDEFRNLDGSTRIESIWDQTISGNPPKGYTRGSVYTSVEIDIALSAKGAAESYNIVPTRDFSGHGTEVASVAAGNNGVASGAEIIVVKLGNAQTGGFPRTVELMLGLNYVIEKAIELEKPLAVNMSFGNTYGAHDGSSLLESFIDSVSALWKSSISVSSGNEGNSAGHTSGVLEENKLENIELAIANRQTGMNIQIWKAYEDDIDISLKTPNGTVIGPIIKTLGVQKYIIGKTTILIYYGEPSPYSVKQEIYVELIPNGDYIDNGIWEIDLKAKQIIVGTYDLWLPSFGVLAIGTNFLRPSKTNTITIPSTARKVITVGAYDALTKTYADFSGRGSESRESLLKPDIVAPGVEVVVSSVNNNIRLASGTSFAAPFVTGSAAMLLEWGIVNGNDPYLYGEKLKTYLRKGAVPLPGQKSMPNIQEGYGALCVENSLP